MRSSEKRRRRAAKAAGGVAVSVLAASTGLMFSESAGASTWTEIEHNIQGQHNNHNGNTGYAAYFVQMVAGTSAISSVAVEVCQKQAVYIQNLLGQYYSVYFTVAHPSVSSCGLTGGAGPFGNVIVMAKDVSPNADASNFGYQAAGSWHNRNTFIFTQNNNGNEHKRADCGYVTPSVGKFWVCGLHTTADWTADGPRAQWNELKNSIAMPANSMFLGDFNMQDELPPLVTGWRLDHQSPYPATSGSKKIDWVLGEAQAHFIAGNPSYTGAYGDGGFNSDHKLLVSYMQEV